MAENTETELDALIQGAAPVTESEEKKSGKGEVEKKSSLSPTLLTVIGIGIGVGGMGYTYLDNLVKQKNAVLEAEFQSKKKEYRIQAHRRMYDAVQGHMQTEMMDRLKNQVGSLDKKGLHP